MNAQENILRVLAEKNAFFVEKLQPIQIEIFNKNKFIESLIFSFNNVDNLIDKCKKAAEVFKKLLDNCQEFEKTIKLSISKAIKPNSNFNTTNIIHLQKGTTSYF